MAVTGDLYNLTLLAKLMALLHHVLFNLAIAAIAKAIMMRISAQQVPSLHRVVPGYLKLVTSSNFWPFMSRLLLLVILLCSVLTSSLYVILCLRVCW